MINAILIITSILANTLGLNSISLKIDRTLIENSSNSSALAANKSQSLPEITINPKISSEAPNANIYAEDYILVDAGSGTILAGENQNSRVPVASTTKIMTAILVIENYDLNQVLVVSPEAANLIDSGLKSGEKMTVLNLLKCLLINSYNGAAEALAEHLNRSGETGDSKFIALMNKKAKDIGMNNTDFHDAAGLDTTGYSTAYDLTLATKYALKKTLFSQIVTTKTEAVSDTSGRIVHQLKNSNRLVADWDYPGILGVKTGYMDEAGHCLVAAARRGEHTLISVVLHTIANTPSASAEESRKLLNWGFENTIWQ